MKIHVNSETKIYQKPVSNYENYSVVALHGSFFIKLVKQKIN